MKNRNIVHRNDWQTPDYFYDPLDAVYKFDFDPCPWCHDVSEWDGLEVDWGQRNFVNPPYSRKLKEAFVRRAVEFMQDGRLSVCLLPVSTSTALFHDVILPNATDITFLRGRIKFRGWDKDGVFVDSKTGQHDSMIVVFDGSNHLSISGNSLSLGKGVI